MGVPKICLLAPLRHELKPLLQRASWRKETVFQRDFYFLERGGGGIVATTSGLGKVMAAATTQFLLDRFTPELLLNFGSCGGLAPGLAIGDLVLAERVVEYDFISHHKPSPSLAPAGELPARLAAALPALALRPGCLASADRNADTPAIRERLYRDYQALAADWEGAAVARVAARRGVPVLILRGVTDLGEDELSVEYEKHFAGVLERVAEGVLEVVDYLLAVGGDLLPESRKNG